MEAEVKTRIPLEGNRGLPWVLISTFSKGIERPDGAQSHYLRSVSGEANAKKEKQREMKSKAAEGDEKTRQAWAWRETSFKPVLAEERTPVSLFPGTGSTWTQNLLPPLISYVTLGVLLHLFELFFFLCKTENNFSTHRVVVRKK